MAAAVLGPVHGQVDVHAQSLGDGLAGAGVAEPTLAVTEIAMSSTTNGVVNAFVMRVTTRWASASLSRDSHVGLDREVSDHRLSELPQNGGELVPLDHA